MNNTDKLLRAFIEASGYDVKEHQETRADEVSEVVGRALNGHEVDGKWYVVREMGDIDYKLTKKSDLDLIAAMGRAIDLMYAEFSCVEPDILTAFEKAGWVNDENI